MKLINAKKFLDWGTVVCMVLGFCCTKNNIVNSGGTSIEVVGISGYVALQDKQMAAGSRVGLRKSPSAQTGIDSTKPEYIALTTADLSGRFVLPCSLNGSFIIEATATNGFKGLRACTLRTKPISIDTIYCHQIGGIKGSIVTDSFPVNFYVQVLKIFNSVTTDSIGQFVLDSIPPGMYSLRIWPEFQSDMQTYCFLDTMIEIKSGNITDLGKINIPHRTDFQNNSAYKTDMAIVSSMLGKDSAAAIVSTGIRNGRVVCINDVGGIASLSGISGLAQLEWLWLMNSTIDTLPYELGACKNLTSLRCDYGKTQWVNTDFSLCPNLFSIEILDCFLEHIPPSLMNLSDATGVYLYNNRICNPSAEEIAWLTIKYGIGWKAQFNQNCN
jgi:hypothetical protein